MNNAWRPRGPDAVLFIVLFTIVAYLPALRGGFVFDDDGLIAHNRMVRASDGLYQFWFTAEAQDYRPLTWSLWWLEWRLWDGRATGYHVVNVLLHAANVVLVWLVLQRLKVPGAWLAALVFAVHPVNVATVAWISEQKNTLSMFFYALAILLYLRFDEEGRLPRSDRGWRWYAFSLAAFLMALLTKTAVVMLPFVLLGCVWWRRGRVQWKDLLCSMPFLLPSLGMGIVTIIQHQQVLAGTVVQAGGFGARLATAGRAPWFYLSKALLPVNLTIIYPKWEIDPSRWVSYVPGATLIGCLIVFWWKRRTWGRPLLFGLGYFVVMLFPVLGFFDQYFYRYSLVADHWQYYSIVGVIALVVAAGDGIDRKLRQRNRCVGVPIPFGAELVGATVLIVLGLATWSRCCVYANSETLWRDNLAKNPGAWMAHNNLGTALEQTGRMQEAIGEYEKALRIKPEYAGAHYNLGRVLFQLGRVPEAIGQYEQALKIKPDFADAHNNLGLVLWQTGKAREAVGHIEQALKIDPNSADAHNNLGMTLWQTDKVPEATEQFEQALKIDPDSVEAHNNFGLAMVRLGKLPEAMEHLEQALRLDPDYVKAHFNLGIALERSGKVPEAIAHYEQALRIQPDYPEARNRLARLRAAQ